MSEEVRRTFPKKPTPGTPFRSPIDKFKRDEAKWNRERTSQVKSETRKEEKEDAPRKRVGGRYFDGGQPSEERKQFIEERRAAKKSLKEEARKVKAELKMKNREVNKVVKKETKEAKKRNGGEMKKKGGKKKKKTEDSEKKKVAAVESDDAESDVDEERAREIAKNTSQHLSHLRGDSDVESEDLPEEDMFGNEKEDEEEEEEESEGEKIPLASTRLTKYTAKKEEEEDDEEVDEDEDEDEDYDEAVEEEEQKETGPALTDIEKFREEMASMPLSKVREVKEKLGIKLFNDAFFGKEEKKKEVEEDVATKNAGKKVFKRDNSKRPREISSKKGSSRFRPIYQEKKIKKRLDPRFDEKCGAFNEVIYDANYGFLDDLRKDEVKKMKKEVLAAKRKGDMEKVSSLREEIIREENRQKAKREKEMRMSTMKELKKENMERMKKGLEPRFVKRSAVKLKIMEKKFAQLKEDNQLDKYMRRKAKAESRKGGSKGGGPKLGV